MAIIVSILSEQLIPNVLFIKQMALPHDNHIFLSTREMEANNKSAILASTLGLSEEKCKLLIIDANNPSLILKKLVKFVWQNDMPYIVNITGGNKLMSQMTYLHFAGKQDCNIYYWPIGSDCLEQLYPVIESVKIAEPYQLDLSTYIGAHGYSYTCQQQLAYPYSKAKGTFQNVIKFGSAEAVPEIIKARESHYNLPDKQYYTGAWFEEWMYAFLKQSLKLASSQIALNLKLKNSQSVSKTENDNEIDVAFVFNNKLYIWECKVYTGQVKSGKIANAIYKISSVSQSLGLQATSLVAILSPLGFDVKRKDFLNDITKIMRVKKVFALEDMSDSKLFVSKIKEIIN